MPSTYLEGEVAMDHAEVVRQKLTERYLLHELDGEIRDQFEEHYFDCSECAMDVRAASEFVAQSRAVLAENAETAVHEQAPRRTERGGWLAWLRPAFAAPALALLLAMVGYQNLVTYPRLRRAVGGPQTLPWAPVTVGTYGPSGPTVPVERGKGFLLLVRIPHDEAYVKYKADLYNPAGALEYSLAIPATATGDQWPLIIPQGNHEPGNYRISVHGVTASGEVRDLGSAPFVLQTQN